MRSRRVFTLLSSGTFAALACSSYTGTVLEETDASNPPVDTSSSSGSISSSSSSSGAAPDASDADSPDVEVADAGSCTSFTIPSTLLACAAPDVLCRGTATLGSSGVFLTVSSARAEPAIGVYWHALGLSRTASFTLTAQLEILQGSGGGPPGHGFAMAWVQSDDGSGFPPLSGGGVNTLGVHRLAGFAGAAAFVRTYENGARGLLGLRATRIPSADEGQLDDWLGTTADVSTFARTDRVHVRMILVNRPNALPTVELLRATDDSFRTTTSLGTTVLPLHEDQRRLDYLGLAAARGSDDLSQSGHRLRSLSLSCDE